MDTSTARTMNRTSLLPVVTCAVLGLAACGGDRDTDAARDGATTTPAAETAPGTVDERVTAPGVAPTPGAPGTRGADPRDTVATRETLHAPAPQGQPGYQGTGNTGRP
jgi:hypothetical protein